MNLKIYFSRGVNFVTKWLTMTTFFLGINHVLDMIVIEIQGGGAFYTGYYSELVIVCISFAFNLIGSRSNESNS